jgi:hypothetical protein
VTKLSADYKLDLAHDLDERYLGRPVLVATSVRKYAFAEVAKKPVPPPPSEELAMDAIMKKISPPAMLTSREHDDRSGACAATPVIQRIANAKIIARFESSSACADASGRLAPHGGISFSQLEATRSRSSTAPRATRSTTPAARAPLSGPRGWQ